MYGSRPRQQRPNSTRFSEPDFTHVFVRGLVRGNGEISGVATVCAEASGRSQSSVFSASIGSSPPPHQADEGAARADCPGGTRVAGFNSGRAALWTKVAASFNERLLARFGAWNDVQHLIDRDDLGVVRLSPNSCRKIAALGPVNLCQERP